MKTLLKIVGELALGFVVFEVVIGLLHALFAVAVVGVSLLVSGVVCVLAVMGLCFLVGGLTSRSRPTKTLYPGRKLASRADNTLHRADRALREMERKIGPRK